MLLLSELALEEPLEELPEKSKKKAQTHLLWELIPSAAFYLFLLNSTLKDLHTKSKELATTSSPELVSELVWINGTKLKMSQPSRILEI